MYYDQSEKRPQKFQSGDLIRIAKDLGSSMSHFKADCDAIVIATYAQQFGGNNVDSYTLLFEDEGRVSWYHEAQLTFIKHVGQEGIKAWTDAIKERAENESALPYIVANWKSFKKDGKYPSASLCELLRMVGVTNPWGSSGEGVNLYNNYNQIIRIFDEVISGGDVAKVQAFAEAFKAERATK